MTPCPIIQRWISLLCLRAFALGQAWLCPSAVWCHDVSTGRAHLEVACGSQDGCHADQRCDGDPTAAMAPGTGAGLHDGAGCIDVAVVQMAIHSARTIPSGVQAQPLCEPPPTLGCVRCMPILADGARTAQPPEVLRPPDPLAAIQFVILVV